MLNTLLLFAGLLTSTSGMAFFALAMKPHWDQVRAPHPYPVNKISVLRTMGASLLLLSLGFCLADNHPSLASLTWLMELTVSAFITALLLAFRPRWLGLLVTWVR